MLSQKPLCIYHGHCDDGFAAAWVVKKALSEFYKQEEVEFYPGVYQQPPPDVTGRSVLIVDFSYKRLVMEEMAAKARSILLLDHHKTAAEDLIDLPAPFTAKLSGIFDMNRSGAGLTWDFFYSNSGQSRPSFINYIEDRDLWRKKLPGGDEFTIALRSYPQDFTVWNRLVAAGPEALIVEGSSIQRYYRLRVEEIKRSAYAAYFLGGEDFGKFQIANAPYFAASEVAGELCDIPDAVFGACYFEVEAGLFQYSLRSRDAFDVSTIAKTFGGGGHRNAAGFTSNGIVHKGI